MILGQRELWHGILFEETNPNREPPKRPNWALCMSQRKGKGEKENPTGRKEQLGSGGGPTGAPLRRGVLFKWEPEHLCLRQPTRTPSS